MSEKQLLHLVIGGRVTDPRGLEFQDLKDIHTVGFLRQLRRSRRSLAFLGTADG